MNNNNPDQNTPADKLSQRRRALLKGSAIAVPAILTLRSGASLAASSSMCMSNTHNNPPSTSPTGIAVDGWLRKQVNVRTLTYSKSGTIPTPPPASPVTVFQDPDNSVNWYDVTGNNHNALFYTQIGSGMTDSNHNHYTYTTTDTGYVLFHVNPDGSPTHVYGIDNTSNNTLATSSCYSSLFVAP